MKKILNITLLLSFVAIFFACTPERVIYGEARGDEVTFPTGKTKIEMLTEDDGKVEIELWRGNTQGTLIVPIVISGDTDVFTPEKEKFIFNDGENKATLVFTYENIESFGGESYNITVEVADPDQLSLSANGVLNLTLSRKLTFSLFAVGTFTSEFMGDIVDAAPSWTQELYKAVEADYYRFPNLYSAGVHVDFFVSSEGEIDSDYMLTGFNIGGSPLYWKINQNYAPSEWNGNTISLVPVLGLMEASGFDPWWLVDEVFVYD